jgi:hypothetical protein
MEEFYLLLDGLLYFLFKSESVSILAVDMENISEAFFDNDKFPVKK